MCEIEEMLGVRSTTGSLWRNSKRSVKRLQGSQANNLGSGRSVLCVLLAVLATLGILAKTGVARLLGRHRRLYDGRRRSIGGLAGMYAGLSLALGDEVSGAFVGDDLKVVGSTGV